MSETLVQDLLDAGIHFGQRRSGWNPRMKPYIWGQRNKIHIIDIRKTVKGLLTASRFIQQTVSEGRDVCFGGGARSLHRGRWLCRWGADDEDGIAWSGCGVGA